MQSSPVMQKWPRSCRNPMISNQWRRPAPANNVDGWSQISMICGVTSYTNRHHQVNHKLLYLGLMLILQSHHNNVNRLDNRHGCGVGNPPRIACWFWCAAMVHMRKFVEVRLDDVTLLHQSRHSQIHSVPACGLRFWADRLYFIDHIWLPTQMSNQTDQTAVTHL